MDIEESGRGRDGKEGFEALRLVAVDEDQELEVVLEPFAIQTSVNPDVPSNQASFPQSSTFSAQSKAAPKPVTGIGSQGPSKNVRETPVVYREPRTVPIARGTTRAKTTNSPSSLQRKSKLEAVMQDWLRNPHEEEEDSEPEDIPAYQPTRPLPSSDRNPAQTPTFPAEKKETTGFEGEMDTFAISKTEDSSPLPTFQKPAESFPKPSQPPASREVEYAEENSEEYFSFKAETRTGVESEEFSFKPGWKRREDVGETDNTSPVEEPIQAVLSDSLPEPRIEDHLSHRPAASSVLMDGLVRTKGNITPPASSSASRGFRRFKRLEGHLNSLQESDISAGLGEKFADDPDLRGKNAGLDGPMNPQERQFQPITTEEEVQRTPVKAVLSEADPLVQGRTDSTYVDSPDHPTYQLVPNTSPDSRPRQGLAEKRKGRLEEEKGPSLPGDIQQKPPPEKYPHSGTTKLPIEREQKATTGERDQMRGDSKLRTVDRGAAAKVRKREEAGKRQTEYEEGKDTSGRVWKDQDASLNPLDDTIDPSFAHIKPFLTRAPEVEESKVPAVAIEKALILKKQPFVIHSDIWPLFLLLPISTNSDPVTLETQQKSSCLTRCFRPAPIELDDTLKDQFRRIYALTEEKLSENALHLLVLMNVWKFLTKAKSECRRFGQHWGLLGFQGTDPGKELGEMGVFGLLQLLFLASNMPDEADSILTYSRQSSTTFPFAKVSLRISAIALATLRTGKLNHLIAKRGEVYRIVRTK